MKTLLTICLQSLLVVTLYSCKGNSNPNGSNTQGDTSIDYGVKKVLPDDAPTDTSGGSNMVDSYKVRNARPGGDSVVQSMKHY